MTALIIGANGYIGRHLSFYLLQKGWSVHGVDISDHPTLQGLSYEKLDVRELFDYEKIDTRRDFIFYLSGITGTTRAYGEYEHYIDVNEKGLMHLLNRMREQKSFARVIFPSTRLVYKGAKGIALKEEAEKEFKTVYALNKWFGENILKQYSEYFEIPYTVFRIGIPYGSFLGKDYSYGTIGFFLNKALAGQPISIYGTGDQKRTFTHIEDICRQMFYTLLATGSENQVYNLGGETFSLKEIAEEIGSKYSTEVTFLPWPTLDAKIESWDTIFDSSSIDKLIKKSLNNNFSIWLKTVR